MVDRNILRHENISLRKTILYKKKKRKRGKAVYYDKGETKG